MGGEDYETNFLVQPLMKATAIQRPSKSLTFLDEDEDTINEGVFHANLLSLFLTLMKTLPDGQLHAGGELRLDEGFAERLRRRP